MHVQPFMSTPEQLQGQGTVRIGDPGRGAELAPPALTTTYPGLRRLPRPLGRPVEGPAEFGEDLAEGVARSADLDGLRRRLLACADVIAAAGAFLVTISLLGQDSTRDRRRDRRRDGDPDLQGRRPLRPRRTAAQQDHPRRGPAVFRVASLYTLIALLAGDGVVEGRLGGGQALFLWVFLFVSMVGGRALARRLAAALVDGERVVIVGSAESAGRLTRQIDRCVGTKAAVVGRVGRPPRRAEEIPVLGEFGALARVLSAHRIDRAVIAPDIGDDERRQLETIRIVKSLGVRISVAPNLLEAVGSAYEFDTIEGSILLGLRRHGLSRSSPCSSAPSTSPAPRLLIVALAPLLAMIAVAIKLDSRGPVIFRQRRVGRDGQASRCSSSAP